MTYSLYNEISFTLWHEDIDEHGGSHEVPTQIDVRYRWLPAEPDVGVMAPYVEIDYAIEAESGADVDDVTRDNIALMLEQGKLK